MPAEEGFWLACGLCLVAACALLRAPALSYLRLSWPRVTPDAAAVEEEERQLRSSCRPTCVVLGVAAAVLTALGLADRGMSLRAVLAAVPLLLFMALFIWLHDRHDQQRASTLLGRAGVAVACFTQVAHILTADGGVHVGSFLSSSMLRVLVFSWLHGSAPLCSEHRRVCQGVSVACILLSPSVTALGWRTEACVSLTAMAIGHMLGALHSSAVSPMAVPRGDLRGDRAAVSFEAAFEMQQFQVAFRPLLAFLGFMTLAMAAFGLADPGARSRALSGSTTHVTCAALRAWLHTWGDQRQALLMFSRTTVVLAWLSSLQFVAVQLAVGGIVTV